MSGTADVYLNATLLASEDTEGAVKDQTQPHQPTPASQQITASKCVESAHDGLLLHADAHHNSFKAPPNVFEIVQMMIVTGGILAWLVWCIVDDSSQRLKGMQFSALGMILLFCSSIAWLLSRRRKQIRRQFQPVPADNLDDGNQELIEQQITASTR